MKFRLLFIVLIPLSIFSQNREFVFLDDEFSHLLNTSDELYIYGDSSNYLMNKQLYLCKIFFWSSWQTDESTYQKMEKFTRQSFNKKTFNIPAPEDIYGFMPAKWFTDTLYVKKANRILSRTWQEKPYYRLIFKKGKLVSTETVANKTWKK